MLPTQKIFKIIAKPNSDKTEIIGFDESRQAYMLNIKARPENNMANIEAIKFLSKILKKKVSIISGLRSREKLVRADQKD